MSILSERSSALSILNNLGSSPAIVAAPQCVLVTHNDVGNPVAVVGGDVCIQHVTMVGDTVD